MTTENDKATAKILLSADEAVAKKIRDVLMKNPDIVRDVIKNMQMDDERITQQIRNQMYQQSVAQQTAYQQQTAMQAQQQYNAYAQGGITQVDQNQLQPSFWNNVFGGKK